MSPGSKTDTYPRERTRLAGRKRHLLLRAKMIQAIRSFFDALGYVEVETPLLVPAPAPEAHIDAIPADGRYLHTSPELCMKRLLAAGFSRIFQISKCFRSGERGDLHLPEFTLLEWYRTDCDYKGLMDECETLFQFVAEQLNRGDSISCAGKEIDLKSPWERLTVEEAFDQYAPAPVDKALADDCFDQIMVEYVEPRLGMIRPTFLYDYPALVGALARRRPDDPTVAERFEIYMAGIELANGFSELTDPVEQRARFEAERRQRAAAGKAVYPMPEPFLRALQHMPEAAGIALGVDRLAMVFSDAERVDQVTAFTPEEL